MDKPDEIRKSVADTYAAVVTQGTGCCGGTEPKGVAAKFAGYGTEETSNVPADAVQNSFGCGNPLAFSEVREGDVVVDLGSGAGLDLLIAARKVGPTGRVIGVDMTDEMIARARENAARAGFSNVEVRKGIIEDLPVESGSADWVISNCVINLSPEKPKVFSEIARVLKPGGRMLVSDIVARDLPAWVRQDAAVYASCIGGAISEEEYLAGLHRAGLVDAEVRGRIAYDAPQIVAIVQSDQKEGGATSCGCGPIPASEAHRDLIEKVKQDFARAVEGKAWSVSIHARKPPA